LAVDRLFQVDTVQVVLLLDSIGYFHVMLLRPNYFNMDTAWLYMTFRPSVKEPLLAPGCLIATNRM
jgi:hypothetical protein